MTILDSGDKTLVYWDTVGERLGVSPVFIFPILTLLSFLIFPLPSLCPLFKFKVTACYCAIVLSDMLFLLGEYDMSSMSRYEPCFITFHPRTAQQFCVGYLKVNSV